MSDNFVQQAALGSGTTTASATLNGVAAGNAIVVVGSVGSNSNPTLHSVSDGTAYTAGASAQDATNNIFSQAFYLLNVGAGTHVVVFTSDSGASCDVFVAEIGTTAGASAAVDTKTNQQTSPGTGTDAIISGSLTIAAAATVWVVSLDTTSANAGDEPVVGTSPFAFTTRQNGVSGNSGAYLAESAAAGANGSATATAANGPAGGHNYITVAISIANAAAGPTIDTQPTDVVANTGTTANYTVAATTSGGSLTYQWQVSTNRGASYSNVSDGSGGTTTSYTTHTIGFADEQTFYRCAVTDSNATTNTRGASLRIIAVAIEWLYRN